MNIGQPNINKLYLFLVSFFFPATIYTQSYFIDYVLKLAYFIPSQRTGDVIGPPEIIKCRKEKKKTFLI